jgi:anthranilate synthase/aminodeoxychorismate synthase-like glutamine amidotransferase
MILVIDNYDSFTYNLVQLLRTLGARVEVLRNDEIDAQAAAALEPAGVVISPGPCGPSQSGNSPAIVQRLAGRTPLLGVCLGHQVIAEVYGARVGRAPAPVHGKTSRVRHDARGVFRNVSDPFVATRYHSLAVVESTLPPELEVTARSEDGVIMGLRHRTLPVEGVQFHPESILTTEGATIMANFLTEATHPVAGWRARRSRVEGHS